MVFSQKVSKDNPFHQVKANKIIEGESISSFQGHLVKEGSNILNYQNGELMYNKNMEWVYSGSSKFLRTKRGSKLYLDIGEGSLGAGVFVKNATNYPVWVDLSGRLKYRDTDGSIITLQSGLDTTYRHEFVFYGLGSNEVLYGANREDGVYKITNPSGTIIYTSVISSVGAWSISYSNISGMLFFTNGHKAYYGGVQNQTASDLTNLEKFDTANKSILVSPDVTEGINRTVSTGELTFFFKDNGIWSLINSEEDIATWLVPQCDADVGTKSPETIQYVKYGNSEVFVYLGSDKTLRLFTAKVERNAGATPTLKGGESLIISKPFQKLLTDIPDGQLSKCTGYYFENYYIFNFVSSSAVEIDSTIILDLDKLREGDGPNDIAQPYWFYADNMEYKHYFVLNNRTLYGIHKTGFIAEVFVKDQYFEEVPDTFSPLQDSRDLITYTGLVGTFVKNETVTGSTSAATGTTTLELSSTTLLLDAANSAWNVGETITGGTSGATATISTVIRRVAIEWSAYVGWKKYNSRELRLYDAYLNWSVDGNWPINFTVNSFLLGDTIPDFDSGNTYPVQPSAEGASYYDFDFFDVAYFSSGSGQLSQNTGAAGRGNYFSFGFNATLYNRWATVYSIEPRFEVIKNDTIGKNF